MEITELIKKIRTQLNLTQEQLAKKLGVDQVTVSCWEKGTRKPYQSNLYKLNKLALSSNISINNDQVVT